MSSRQQLQRTSFRVALGPLLCIARRLRALGGDGRRLLNGTLLGLVYMFHARRARLSLVVDARILLVTRVLESVRLLACFN